MPQWWLARQVLDAAIVLITVLSMEVVAHTVHRYWMHGPGWGWHRSHHEHRGVGWFERNDLFGVVFAAAAVGLMLLGQGSWWPLYGVGIGMTLYGVLYAVLHDGLIHRRWPLPWKTRHRYLRRLIQAHLLHHVLRTRRDGVSFGFLYAPPLAQLVAQRRLQQRQGDRALMNLHRPTQSFVGLMLLVLLTSTWALTLSYALFGHWGTALGVWLAPLMVLFICWLDTGLFIMAHDAMHGSLVPMHRRLNQAAARLCLGLYAGFALGCVSSKHFEHHHWPGTGDDPDFVGEGAGFWRWYTGLMRRYFGWRQALFMAVVFVLLVTVFNAPLGNVLVFWALPAVLSSLQLFYFGTWLPHRTASSAFADRHRARSNAYGWWVSLLTCFHFGYHHEHHLRPDVPWWHLPAVRRAVSRSDVGPGGSTDLPGASTVQPRHDVPVCPPPR